MSSGSSSDIPEHPEQGVAQARADPEQPVAELTLRFREFATTLVRTEQRERRRVSGILRDQLQQMLYGVQLRLRMARDVLDAGREEEAGEQLVQAEALLQQCARVTRQLRFELSPPVLEHAGLKSILSWLRGPMREMHGLDVELVGDEVRVDDGDVRMLLFQMLHELLFNVATHSGARKARVSLRDAENEVRLEIADDGRGIGTAAIEGESRDLPTTALAGVRDGIGVLGGRLEIESRPGSGTVVQVRFPRSALFAV